MSIDDIKPCPCSELYAVEHWNIAERTILDLAVLFHKRKNGPRRHCVVPYNVQVIAYSFFEQFGLEACLAELAKGMSE